MTTQPTQTSSIPNTHDDNAMHQAVQHQPEQQDMSACAIVRQAQLTPKLHAGAEVLQQQAADIVTQIDDLTKVGVDFIDHLKQEFLGRMAEARRQIEEYSALQTSEWETQSRDTLTLQERLHMAGQLMGSLEASFHGR